jgi:hypothetical protein
MAWMRLKALVEWQGVEVLGRVNLPRMQPFQTWELVPEPKSQALKREGLRMRVPRMMQMRVRWTRESVA